MCKQGILTFLSTNFDFRRKKLLTQMICAAALNWKSKKNTCTCILSHLLMFRAELQRLFLGESALRNIFLNIWSQTLRYNLVQMEGFTLQLYVLTLSETPKRRRKKINTSPDTLESKWWGLGEIFAQVKSFHVMVKRATPPDWPSTMGYPEFGNSGYGYRKSWKIMSCQEKLLWGHLDLI